MENVHTKSYALTNSIAPPAIRLCVVPPAICLCVVDTQDSRDLTAESEHNADFSKSKLHSSDIKELCLTSQITAKDGTGYDLLTIKVYILKNPCMKTREFARGHKVTPIVLQPTEPQVGK